MIEIKDEYIKVKITPQSQKNEITKILDSPQGKTIKINIKAAPEKNKANEELIKFLSKELNMHTDNIKILSGRTQRTKLIKLCR